jgi:hypothetical protein
LNAPRTPKALDAIVDVVLAYKPKPKSKPARRRKRRATKLRSATPHSVIGLDGAVVMTDH